MRVTLSAVSPAMLACAALLLAGSPVEAQPAAGPKILILNSFDHYTEPYAAVRDAFMWQLQARFDDPIAFVQLDLQQRGPSENINSELQAGMLRNQHGDALPDLVVATVPLQEHAP